MSFTDENPNATTICKACNNIGHRVHTCPNDKLREEYFEKQIKQTINNKSEIIVVRRPTEGKYYSATFWTRRTGDWTNEIYYTDFSRPIEYAGLYLRHRQQGYGDGADHWAIFLKDGKEHEIEYDYEGKRAFYEV
jgi:hypothetical protein